MPAGSSAGCARSSALDHVRGEVVGAHAGQRAAVAAERRADRVEDVGVAHRWPFVVIELAAAPSAPRRSAASVVVQVVGDLQLPAGRLPRLLDRHARVHVR